MEVNQPQGMYKNVHFTVAWKCVEFCCFIVYILIPLGTEMLLNCYSNLVIYQQ